MIQVIKQEDRVQEVTIYDEIPLASDTRPFFYTLVICLSTVYSGCSLTIIAATKVSMLQEYYDIDLSFQSTLSLLNGILPVGGMLGAILVPNILPLTTKKKAVYFLMLASWIVTGLSIVPQALVLVMSRFLLGVLNGLHMSLAAAYIKQTFPSHIRKPLGSIYSTCRIFGMLLCYLFAEISNYTLTDAQHILLFLSPAIIATIQSVLFYLVMPDAIVEAITKLGEDRALECLAVFYDEENIEDRYMQMRKEIASAVRRTLTFQKIRMNNRKNLSSMHMAVLRQFCGQTYIVIYARQVLITLDSPYANMSGAIINGVQLIAGVASIYTVQKFQRFWLLISGCALLSLLNVGIGLMDYYELSVECLIAMTVFMIPNGICLSSVAWSYPSELVPASQGKYSSLLNWACSTMVAMIPPYVVAETPNQSAYPIFFFFALYLVAALMFNLRTLPRTDKIRRSGNNSVGRSMDKDLLSNERTR